MNNSEVMCSSPTCRRTIVIMYGHRYLSQLRAEGWKIEVQAGDEHSKPYCPRCKL